jgi:DNA polymerase-3 subunit delta'
VPWDIAGHRNEVASLRSAVTSGQAAHAYMFAGVKGIGKARLARLFAQALLCESSPSEAPCGSCRSCLRVDHGNHPDLHWLTPIGSSFRIDQVRAMQAQISRRPYEGRYKICVLDDAETLTEQAQNSMLKVLEEPPGNGILLLIVHRPAAILPTIHSRCQTVSMRPVATEVITQWLLNRCDITPQQAALLAALSGGRPGVALDLEAEAVIADRDRVASWSIALRRDRLKAVWPIASELEVEKDLDDWLGMMMTWFRDVWHRFLDPELPVTNIDAIEQLDEEAAGWQTAALQALVAIGEARRALSRNGQKRLVLDVMLMRMQRGIP